MTQTTLEGPLMTSTTTTAKTAEPVARHLGQFRRDNTYLLPQLPLAVVAFAGVIATTAASVSLLVIAVGLPLLALSLMLARGFASVERLRLRALGMRVPEPGRPTRRDGWRGWVDAVSDRRSWLDALHAVVTFPSAVATWSVTVTWWAGALGGLSYPLWRWALPDDPQDDNVAQFIGIDSAAGDIALHVGIGLAFAVTIVPVVRGLAGLQSGLSRAVLAPEQVGTPGAR